MSDEAIKACISQSNEKKYLKSVAYHLRKLTSTEINYEIHNKELLAIVKTLKLLRQKVITNWVSAIVSYILTLSLSHYTD